MSSSRRTVRDGVNQLERFPQSLGNDFVQLEDRSVQDMFTRLIDLSSQFAFYNIEDIPQGTWQNLLPQHSEVKSLTEELARKGNVKPHVALMLTFLRLTGHAQKDLNSILSGHLEAFYKKVLGLKTNSPVSDQVHVFFSLKKNVPSITLDEGIKLDAGTGPNGSKVLFTTNRRLNINAAKIESVKSLYFDRGRSGKIYAAPVANSLDGLGEAFTGESQSWSLLGPNDYTFSFNKLAPLQEAVGFAFASPMLLLAGGERNLTLDFIYRATPDRLNAQFLDDQLTVEFSGEEGWLTPSSSSAELLFREEVLDPVTSSPVRYENINVADFVSGTKEYYSPFSVGEEGNLLRTLTRVTTEIETVEVGPQQDAIVTTETNQEILTPVLRLSAEFGEEIPAIVAPSEENYPRGPKAQWPVCRVLIRTSENESAYSFLRNIQLRQVEVHAEVNGLKALEMENDRSDLNPKKTFLPFGSIPAIGNSFYFGNEELARKAISDFSVDLVWDQVPAADLGLHYYPYVDSAAQAYADAVTGKEQAGLSELNSLLPVNPDGTQPESLNETFRAVFLFRLNQQWLPLAGPGKSLFGADASGFNADGSANYHRLSVSATELEASLKGTGYGRLLGASDFNREAFQARQGFLGLSLRWPEAPIRAFGHSSFSQATLATAVHNANPGNSGNQRPLPSPPYTPAIKELKLNYQSRHTVFLDQESDGEQFFHLEPFGYYEPLRDSNVTLFPNFKDKGNLFIGLSGIQPPQQVSILFQLQEGSADPEAVISPEELSWHYLSQNRWIRISREDVLLENTERFQTSGVVELLIGKEATPQNSRFLDDLYWLKLSVRDQPQGANLAIDLHTNAVAATRLLDPELSEVLNNQPLELLLPPNQIKKLQNQVAAVSKVNQPYTSFGGKPEEQDEFFLTRISERLRHRQRAVTYWDFERIVLGAFPSIFKVKCLPHTAGDNDAVPGTVSLVVVSNLRRKNASNPFQPQTSSITLSRIEKHLSGYSAPSVKIRVENPTYEPMLLDLKVSFRSGFDPGSYSKQLNREIKEFLSPWAFADGQDIVLGGRIKSSAILGFIEGRPYVDFVADFELYHLFDGPDPHPGIGQMCVGIDFVIRRGIQLGVGEMIISDNFIVGEPEEEAIASTPRSILVSAQDHRIRVLETGSYVCQGRIAQLGIGFMRIGGDFIVGDYDYAIGNTEIVPLAIGGNPAFTSSTVSPEDFKVYDASELPNNPN